MSFLNSRTLSLFAAASLLAVSAAATARAADCESDRIMRFYERCYGPNGPYCISCDRCGRAAQAEGNDCDRHHTCCYRCVTNFFGPGSTPPCKCLDICLYRGLFPISPWYSHPRDGIHYPAYGSKSPGCVPARNW